MQNSGHNKKKKKPFTEEAIAILGWLTQRDMRPGRLRRRGGAGYDSTANAVIFMKDTTCARKKF
jgi:hypothetical protein